MVRHRADKLLAAHETFALLNDAPNLPELEDWWSALRVRLIPTGGCTTWGTPLAPQPSSTPRTTPAAARSGCPGPPWWSRTTPCPIGPPTIHVGACLTIVGSGGGSYYDEFTGFTGDDVIRAGGQLENDCADDETSAAVAAAAATTATKTLPPPKHNLHVHVLFSHKWSIKRWGASHILSGMHEQGLFGARLNASAEQWVDWGVFVSHVQVINWAHHSKFFDASMLKPLWPGVESDEITQSV
jgi:hypothetical protein